MASELGIDPERAELTADGDLVEQQPRDSDGTFSSKQ